MGGGAGADRGDGFTHFTDDRAQDDDERTDNESEQESEDASETGTRKRARGASENRTGELGAEQQHAEATESTHDTSTRHIPPKNDNEE